MSHPSPRTSRIPAGVAGDVMRATVSGARMRAPSSAPSPRSIRPKRARSAAVENNPAWPATPPMRRAVGSCTAPRSIAAPATPPRHGHSRPAHASVGAMRPANSAGGRNIVSCIPSGSKMRSAAKRSSGSPLTRSTISPRSMKFRSL